MSEEDESKNKSNVIALVPKMPPQGTIDLAKRMGLEATMRDAANKAAIEAARKFDEEQPSITVDKQADKLSEILARISRLELQVEELFNNRREQREEYVDLDRKRSESLNKEVWRTMVRAEGRRAKRGTKSRKNLDVDPSFSTYEGFVSYMGLGGENKALIQIVRTMPSGPYNCIWVNKPFRQFSEEEQPRFLIKRYRELYYNCERLTSDAPGYFDGEPPYSEAELAHLANFGFKGV